MQAEEAETGEPLPEKNVPGDVLKLDKQVQIKVFICASIQLHSICTFTNTCFQTIYHDNIFS